MIRVNGEQFWLYAAVDPETNHVLHIRLYPRRTNAITEMFLAELTKKHDVAHAEFLVDGAPWLQTACDLHGLQFRLVPHENRNSAERVYSYMKWRTNKISNTISHVDPTTAENWLLAHARCLDGDNLTGSVTLDDLVATIGEQFDNVSQTIETQSPDYQPSQSI